MTVSEEIKSIDDSLKPEVLLGVNHTGFSKSPETVEYLKNKAF